MSENADILHKDVIIHAQGESGQKVKLRIPLRFKFGRPTLTEVKKMKIGSAPRVGRPTLGIT